MAAQLMDRIVVVWDDSVPLAVDATPPDRRTELRRLRASSPCAVILQIAEVI